MNRSISFVNNKVAEPTVAFVNIADERKERIVLAGVISLLSVFFITTFITVGFLVPRGFWEPLSATVENGMSVYKPLTFPKLSVHDVKSEVSVEINEDIDKRDGKGKRPTELRPEILPIDEAVEEEGTTVRAVLAMGDVLHRPNVPGLKPLPVYKAFTDDTTAQVIQLKGGLHRPDVSEYKPLPVPLPAYRAFKDNVAQIVPKKGGLHRPNVAEHEPLPVYKPFEVDTVYRKSLVPKKVDLHRPNVVEQKTLLAPLSVYKPFEDDTIDRKSVVPKKGDLRRPDATEFKPLPVPLPVYKSLKDDLTDSILPKKGDLHRPNVAGLKPITAYNAVEEGIIVRTVLTKRYLQRQNVLERKPLRINRAVRVTTQVLT